MRHLSTGLIVGALLTASPAAAQNYSGTFVHRGGDQGVVTLTLQQAAAGTIAGTLSAWGSQFTVDGMLQDGSAVGTVYNESVGVYFEATLSSGQLILTLIEPGPDNRPNYAQSRQLVFEPQAGVSQRPRAAGPGAKPPPRSAQGTGANLIGAWSCQTAEGPARLVFHNANQLEYNGQGTTYQITRDVLRVQTEYGVVDYRYQLGAGTLTIAGPDGTAQCQKERHAAAGPGAAPGAQPQGTGMERALEGMRCSYSSSPDGGYASSTRAYFDGQGRFWVGSESSFSVESGSGYGSSGRGPPGQYRVMGVTKGSQIQLRFADGSTGVAEVFHVSQGTIYELMYEGTHFAAALCD